MYLSPSADTTCFGLLGARVHDSLTLRTLNFSHKMINAKTRCGVLQFRYREAKIHREAQICSAQELHQARLFRHRIWDSGGHNLLASSVRLTVLRANLRASLFLLSVVVSGMSCHGCGR